MRNNTYPQLQPTSLHIYGRSSFASITGVLPRAEADCHLAFEGDGRNIATVLPPPGMHADSYVMEVGKAVIATYGHAFGVLDVESATQTTGSTAYAVSRLGRFINVDHGVIILQTPSLNEERASRLDDLKSSIGELTLPALEVVVTDVVAAHQEAIEFTPADRQLSGVGAV